MPAKKNPVKVARCPTCGTLVRPGDEDFPFCSDRCRQIDLGKWASGAYKISSPIVDPEVLEDLGGLAGGAPDDTSWSPGKQADTAKNREMTSPSASRTPPVPARKTIWAWTIATFFGAGLGKPGPGTYGSIAALLLWAAFAWGAQPGRLALALALGVGIALSIIVGVPAATIAARESGRQDPGFVVIDEVAGQWIALLGSPADWRHGVIALILFRIFDITKPFPARQLERLPEGWGIVFDDVAAGLYALGVASLLRIWI